MDFYHFFGFIGYSIIAYAMYQKNDIVTKKFIVFACLVNSLYFVFQDLYISSGIAILTGLRIWLSLYHLAKQTVWIFIAVTITLPFCLPSTDYIAIIPSMLGIIAVFWLEGFLMRAVMLTGTAFWILNNYVEGAWIGFWGELMVFSVGITRLLLWSKPYNLNSSNAKKQFQNEINHSEN